MGSIIILILIILGIIGLFILYKLVKPYFIKYDTTILFTGGLGSGKSIESVKTAIVLLRRQRLFKYYLPNWWNKNFSRPIKRLINWCRASNKQVYHNQAKKYVIAQEYNSWLKSKEGKCFFWNDKRKKYKKIHELKPYKTKPMLYSNMPIHFKSHIWTKKKDREWNIILTPKHIYLLKPLIEYSVVLIDEFPQFINQFMFDEPLVQDNCNEFITYFRHLCGGFLILNSQSESDIVVQFRRKLNQAIWCFDFKKHLFGLFYTNRMADIMLSDNVSTIAQSQIEENTKIHFGLFPPKGTYDTRCYSPRYKETLLTHLHEEKANTLKTNRILRAKYYLSPLDKTTTKEEKQTMLRKAKKLERD